MLEPYQITVWSVGAVTCEDYNEAMPDMNLLLTFTYPYIKREWYTGQNN